MTAEMIAQAIVSDFQKLEICPIYDYWLPPEENPGLYANLGTSTSDMTPTKHDFGIEELSLSFHVWSDRLDHRGKVAEIMNSLTAIAQRIKLEGKSIALTYMDRKVLTDTSTTTPFLHGVVYFEFLH